MLNCIFYSLIFTLFLNVSVGSLRFSQINRVFMSIYRGMFEACLITVDQNGESIIPYYNKEKLEFYIEDYFEKNIKRYSKDYLIDIKFLDDDKYELCSFDCRAVSINLKAKINMFYNYDKTQLFEVVSRENL